MRAINLVTRFKPGSFGAGFQTESVGIGTGGTAMSGSATVSSHIGLPVSASGKPLRKLVLQSLSVTALTAAAGSAALTIQAFKRDNQGTPANRTLTGTFDLTSANITTTDKTYDMPITATVDAYSIFLPGDTLRIDAVAAGTVTTQPQVVVTALFALIY